MSRLLLDTPLSNIDEFVDKALKTYLNGKSLEDSSSSIKEYEKKTKRRFRRTKDQIKRNLSREEAFNEFIQKVDEG